jgi:methionyl-tRNA formyltransferase
VSLRVVFMGTPEFAVPTLKALHTAFQVTGVLTQPDKQRGRGRKTVPTAVKAAALEIGIPVAEPLTLNSAEILDLLRKWSSDVAVVVAYGKLLRRPVLDLPRMGCVNLHGSLLPRHRGASPIAAAILAGDKEAGVCTMVMDEGLDTGDVLLCRSLPIGDNDTTGSLHDKLMELGSGLVVETLKRMEEGSLAGVPQNHDQATYCRQLTKQDGSIIWNRDADFLGRHVRAMHPWPGAFFLLKEEPIKVWEAAQIEREGEPGRVEAIGPEGIVVGTGKGTLLLKQLQAPGRKPVTGAELARGRRVEVGDSFL